MRQRTYRRANYFTVLGKGSFCDVVTLRYLIAAVNYSGGNICGSPCNFTSRYVVATADDIRNVGSRL
jgi:hypothetical protein